MKKQCSACGGSGQVGFFQGVSRFVITWEECPQCCGTGFENPGNAEGQGLREKGSGRPKKTGKKGK